MNYDFAFDSELNELKSSDQLRFLRKNDFLDFIDFSNNDYLCLSNDKKVAKFAFEYAKKYSFGGRASRLINASSCYQEIEDFIAKIKKKESGLIFPSGYQLNSTVIPSLIRIFKEKFHKVDIFSDRFNHASIQHGIMLSGERQNRYKHQDLDQLEEMLKKSDNFKFVITETIFSMDGTITDIKKLIELKKKYDFFLYIDDAHSFGVYGENMLGTTEGFEDDIDIIMGTFSKSVGCQGGYLVSKKNIVDLLVNKNTGFICSTAISPFLIGFAINAIKKFPSFKKDVRKMLDLVDYVRKLFLNKINLKGDSHIIPLLDEKLKLNEIHEKLLERKIITYIVKHPTVPLGEERIRLSFNISHKKEDVDLIYSCL